MKFKTAKLNIVKATKELNELYYKVKPSFDSLTEEGLPQTTSELSSIRTIFDNYKVSLENLEELSKYAIDIIEDAFIEAAKKEAPINIVKTWMNKRGYNTTIEGIDESVSQLLKELKKITKD